MIQTILNHAKSYLGTTQGDKRHKDIIDKYNAVKPLPVGYEMKYSDDWCAAFVTVIADLSGAASYIGRECGVQRYTQIFKRKGIWEGITKPRPGDLIVFDWAKDGWSDHIGIVESFNGVTVTAIEGNTSDALLGDSIRIMIGEFPVTPDRNFRLARLTRNRAEWMLKVSR